MSVFGWRATLPDPSETALKDFREALQIRGVFKQAADRPFFINPGVQGVFVPGDLLKKAATIGFRIIFADLSQKIILFRASDQAFAFSLELLNGTLVLRRNDASVTIPMTTDQDLTDLPKSWTYHEIMAHWTENRLGLRQRLGREEKEQIVETEPTIAPPSLKDWVRRNNLEEGKEYATEEEFRSKVQACLESIQDKVDQAAGVTSFWDITYSGNAIRERKPKRETETDSDYHIVLSDDSGSTIIAEIPCPCCIGSTSPFGSDISAVRGTFDAHLSATPVFQTANIPVQVTGRMFDFLHGQTGLAPNGIELHPVIGIAFNVDAHQPQIFRASIAGKQLLVSGLSFGDGAVILLDGERQKTANDPDSPSTSLIGKKAGKFIAPGQAVNLQVRNSDGTLSDGFPFTRPIQ